MLTQALILLLSSAPYVRATATKEPGAHCLWWQEKALTWAQNSVGDQPKGIAGLDQVSQAFATWQRALASCSDVTLTEGARTSSRKVGLATGGAANTNLVLFRWKSCAQAAPAAAPCWADGSCANVYDCWDHPSGLLGVTTLSFITATGRVVDADIELNAAENLFTIVNAPVCGGAQALTCVATDVQNTVTHEVGHLLGLAHSATPGSTMNATSSVGDLAKRKVDADSAQFVCDVYPPKLPAQDCVEQTTPATHQGCGAASGEPGALGALLGLLFFGSRVRRARRAGLALALVLTTATAAQATTLLALELDRLTSASDVVVRASVVRVQARWTQDHARIVTDVELEVHEAWKGAPAKRVVLVLPGGTAGGMGQLVEGVARFVSGEEVVAFLEARGPVFTVTGFAQGRFTVEHSAAEAVAGQVPAVDALFLDPVTQQEVPWSPLRLPLSELQARVRALAR
jgi:hypothetical protein